MVPAHSVLGLALGSVLREAWTGGGRGLDSRLRPPLLFSAAHMSSLRPSLPSASVWGQAVLGGGGPTEASRSGEAREKLSASTGPQEPHSCLSCAVAITWGRGTDVGTQGAGGSSTYLWGARGR